MSETRALAEVQAFTDTQLDLIKRTICAGATNDELALFVQQCKRTGLDPFSRQIHCVKRSGKMVIQTGIDGYRLIADRTGRYAGNDDPIFDDDEKPRKATVTVWKIVNGVRCPFTATARWNQYYPGKGQGFMWEKMPHLMLGKCAEALALRKAFPAELSGLYTHEEMEQAGPPVNVPGVKTAAQLAAKSEPVEGEVIEEGDAYEPPTGSPLATDTADAIHTALAALNCKWEVPKCRGRIAELVGRALPAEGSLGSCITEEEGKGVLQALRAAILKQREKQPAPAA